MNHDTKSGWYLCHTQVRIQLFLLIDVEELKHQDYYVYSAYNSELKNPLVMNEDTMSGYIFVVPRYVSSCGSLLEWRDWGRTTSNAYSVRREIRS